MRIGSSLIFALLLLFTTKVLAGCLEQAAERYRVSPLLLEAIAETESSGNPLAVGALVSPVRARFVYSRLLELSVPFSVSSYKGRYLFSIRPGNRQQAEKVLKLVSRYADTYDVGLMQINKLWIERYNLKPEWLLDECYNANWGAYVLARMVARYGYTWEAIWHYNGSPVYAGKVMESLRKLCLNKYSDLPYCRKYFGEVARR